ncbi:GH23495 [Drosophila grimshawi]|uniref:GH23495 n=2 Tax=Drosophila grimshawi TaxID=7222 RepID=B4JT58_DROGR|nr:GH23495 [Drosophila grimshawi]
MKEDIILQHFVANCQKLEIETIIWQNAIKTFHKLNSDGYLTSEAKDWLCCAIYCELQQAKIKNTRQEAEAGDDPASKKVNGNSWNISLTKLLRRMGINIMRFLKRMEHWIYLAQSSAISQKEIVDIKRHLGINRLLLQHYKHLFRKLYVLPPATETESRSHYQMVYEFGWLLFLAARNDLPVVVSSCLVTGCQVLVCALELVYVNALEVPSSDIINAEFKGLPTNWSCGDFDIDLLRNYSALEAICELIPELSSKSVSMMRKIFHKAVMSMFMDQRLLGNDRSLRHLIKDGILEVNLASLNSSYAQHVSDITEIDERILLTHFIAETPSKAQLTGKQLPRNGADLYPYAQLSLSSSQRDNLLKLLTGELLPSMPVHISNELDQHESNVLETILLDMCNKFESAVHFKGEAMECCLHLGKGLYYTLLGKILAAELQRRPTLKVGQFLMQKNRFNATLIACCLQLMLHILGSTLQLQWLLQLFAINAYEFHKIIELVVTHGRHLLTRNLAKHLGDLEVRCLDSLIWQRNSPLWLIYGNLPRYQHVQLSVSSASICLRKFYYLANQRLVQLCKGLCMLEEYPQIWHIVEHSISVHGAELLLERHLDQLLLCAVHLCMRKLCLRSSFSDIIFQYRYQPHAQSAVYREVYMSPGQPTTDIISFYNRCYVPRMLDYAQSLHCKQFAKDAPKRPLLEQLSNNGHGEHIMSNGLNMNVFLTPEPMPTICKAADCQFMSKAETPLYLKRARSSDELIKSLSLGSGKRPNIHKQRTSCQ